MSGEITNLRDKAGLELSGADVSLRRCLTRRALVSAVSIAAGIGASALLPIPVVAQESGAGSKRDADKSKDGSKSPPFRTRGQSRQESDSGDTEGSRSPPRPVPGGLPGVAPETDGRRKNEP